LKCLISIKLIRIESIHKAGFVHRDIKPNNFVMGLPCSEQQDQIFLIDFGLSKQYKDKKSGYHYP
jgi:serine/threonine protein kinase